MRIFSLLAMLCLWIGPAQADAPKVAADVRPVHALVARVMLGVGEPALIVPPGASPHDHALRPSEARAIERADVLFWAGEALSPWLAKRTDALNDTKTVINLTKVVGTRLLASRSGHSHSHDDVTEHGMDPHSWLDPDNAIVWLSTMARTLAKIDPDNADTYHANANAGIAEITIASAQAEKILTGKNTIAVFHDAYQYFENRFGLPIPIVVSQSDASPPGAAHLAQVRNRILRGDISCLLAEPSFNAALADRLIEGTGTRTVILDPMGGALAPGRDFFPTLIVEMAKGFAACTSG